MFDNVSVGQTRIAESAPRQVYPYRRVWRALLFDFGAMLAMVLIVLLGVAVGFLRDVPSNNWGLLLILVPLGTHLWFSVRAEQRAEEPRQGLLTILLFSALLANGIGVPLVDGFFAPREWLAEAGFFSRVLGYAFTFGVTAEFLTYIAVRYTVFPSGFRTRIDGMAYSASAGMGYAAVLNAHVVFAEQSTVTADAVIIALNYFSQVSFGMIMGFFLADLAVAPRKPPYYLALGLLLGAVL
ncbi:MAG: hypothetical protein ACLFTK_14710, partial [Anaerolineales bacterium]